MAATRSSESRVEKPRRATGSEGPVRNKQQDRSQLSTSRLLSAAADFLADRGYRQTSLADIGQRAGYSHGLVTRRFGSKLGLLIALLDHMVDDWTEKDLQPALKKRTGIKGIRAFFAAFGDNANANSTNLKALETFVFEGLWGEPELKERLIALQKRGHEQFRELIEGGIEDGTVRPDVDVDSIALLASTALRGATYRWLLEDDFDLRAALAKFSDVLEDLLRVGGPRPSGRRAVRARRPAKSGR